MNSSAALSRPAQSRPGAVRRTKASLQLVQAPAKSRPTLWVMLAVFVTLVLLVGSSIVMNTHMAQVSWQMREVQLELNQVSENNEMLREQLQEMSAPAKLEQAARANGMVPAGPAGFISLQEGTVEGGVAAYQR